MKVSEIFYSIQGESSFTGWPFAFVRLAGCNLRCTYCDTKFAFGDGVDMTVADVVGTVQAYTAKHVLLTGGEPLLQEGVYDLMRQLLDRGYAVCIETGGHASNAHAA